ncbi:hypothetical protein CU048_08920 [Beijerinckiaceae bacterium]|nr:hypothetical protein CU048_08920 [Beijerinckiaceae bacterium]
MTTNLKYVRIATEAIYICPGPIEKSNCILAKEHTERCALHAWAAIFRSDDLLTYCSHIEAGQAQPAAPRDLGRWPPSRGRPCPEEQGIRE